MPRRVCLVIDVSGSMAGQKLEDAKVAFAALMALFREEDTVAVHAFSNAGVESNWGPSSMPPSARSEVFSAD